MNRHVDNSRDYWNARYARVTPRENVDFTSSWIVRVLASTALSLVPGLRALDLGSGDGEDTELLVNAGCHVTALDFSESALARVAARTPGARLVKHLLPAPLPFEDGSFEVVVAGLSLHYFGWADTVSLISDIRRLIQPSGVLVWRVNATGDLNFGFGQGNEIEKNLFDVDGRLKRFFDEESCRALFEDGWRLHSLNESIEHKYDAPKHTWEGVAERLPD